eukprot:m.338164 g.338164  ORF g.338164 m.338164 type:complete len:525 (+) comp18327_c0_seq1:79-1653(+)
MAGTNLLLLLSLLLFVFNANISAHESGTVSRSVKLQGGQIQIVEGIDKTAAAYGTYTPETAGWDKLNLVANSKIENVSEAYYAVGYLEASFQCGVIANFSKNNDDINQNEQIINFTRSSRNFMESMINSHTNAQESNNITDYWMAVKNVLAQFKGVADGYNTYCATEEKSSHIPLTEEEMFFMQMDGDLGDLQAAFGTNKVEPVRCSVVYKLTPDFSDVWFGHATWDTFANMAPRVFKAYTVPVSRAGDTVMHTVSFSSSPSWLSSIDDWYLVGGSSQLAVTETSHEVSHDLYQYLTPNSVFCWIRTIVANQLATDGNSWGEIFNYKHSGTYNNEWHILDLSKFQSKMPPQAGLFTVLEEIPGTMVWQDETATLKEKLYWPSFNIPYFADVQKKAGYSPKDYYSDDRYCLFTQLESSITDESSMEKVMRHNNFKYDNCSHGDACRGAIACRADQGAAPQFFGALDGKWSNVSSAKNLFAFAQMGPTYDQQPVFCWASAGGSNVPHYGHPECFHYPTEMMSVPKL